MRSKWSRKSPQFSCLFSDREIRSELSAGGRVIWSGTTNPELRINSRPAAMTSDWRELCWFSDNDVDYLELEVSCAGGWKIQRQMLLARRDNFLLLADAVLGPEKAKIQYDSRLPLADDITFLPEEATHEGYLKNSRPLCTVLPLSLPEWRAAAAQGKLELEGDQLHLSLNASSQRLYAPLFFDLASGRWVEKRTWRQLTVADQLRIVERAEATGYRIQMGSEQWMVYRSLGDRHTRTVLGKHLIADFYCCRFDPGDGSHEELITVYEGESDDDG